MTQSLSKLAIQCFDHLAPFYDRKTANRKKYNTAIDNQIIKYLSKQDKPKILDVGCGTGKRSENLKRKIKGSRFFGVDASSRMIAIAKKKNLDLVLKADMLNLPFKSEYFNDVICLFNTFGYLSSRSARLQALVEFWRVLAKNGLLFIDVMNAWHLGEGGEFRRSSLTAFWDWLRSFIDPSLNVGDKVFNIEVNRRLVKGFVHGFRQSEMRSLLKQAGFKIEKSYIIGYDSGRIKNYFWEGQFFYICKKI